MSLNMQYKLVSNLCSFYLEFLIGGVKDPHRFDSTKLLLPFANFFHYQIVRTTEGRIAGAVSRGYKKKPMHFTTDRSHRY